MDYRLHLIVTGFLLRKIKKMERQISELSSEASLLATENMTVKKADQAKSEFFAIMSHEIRTPLSGVINLIEFLRETKLDSDQHMLVKSISGASSTLKRIVDNLLDFSKIDARKMELDEKECSLLDIIEQVGDNFHATAQNKNLHLNTYVDPRLPKIVVADELRIRQILSNLLGNAIKFTKTSDNTIGAIELGAQVFSINKSFRVGVCFYVQDNGIGISKDQQEYLFEAFHQLDGAPAIQYGGTGLGLFISARLVHLMKGVITIDSEEGDGATFSFMLEFDEALDASKRKEQQVLDGLNCLIISDDISTSRILSEYLEYSGCQVRLCDDHGNNVPQMLNKANAIDRGYDIVIDARHTGIEKMNDTITQVRNNRHFSRLPYVVLFKNVNQPLINNNENCYILRANSVKRDELINTVAKAVGKNLLMKKVSGDLSLVSNNVLPDSLPLISREEAIEKDCLILVAEDNLLNQDVIKRQLNRLGFVGDIVADGQQALEAMMREHYALVLTDCHMPNVDGFALASRVREGEKTNHKHMPIIAITADGNNGDIDRFMESGIDEYLLKPIKINELDCLLKKWISKRSLNGHKKTLTKYSGLAAKSKVSLSSSLNFNRRKLPIIYSKNNMREERSKLH